MKRLLLFASVFGFFLVSTAAYSQQKVLYRSPDKKLLTKPQLGSLVQSSEAKVAPLGSVEIKTIITKPDTLLYDYALRATSQEVAENEQRYQQFVGKPLPTFAFVDIKGKKVTSKELRGKPLVINLWFTTCGPCIIEMPELNAIQTQNPNVEFLAITYESKEKVLAFLKKWSFAFRHVVAARAYCDQFTTSYPLSIFVDKAGIVRYILGGIPLVYDNATGRLTNKLDSTEFRQTLRSIQ